MVPKPDDRHPKAQYVCEERVESLSHAPNGPTPDRRSEADGLAPIALQRALDLLSESASKLPENPQMQYHLGVVYVKLGDKERAEKALALAVTAPEAFQGKNQARKARSDR